MNKKQERKQNILHVLKHTQLATTPQLEVLFQDSASPKKRCSELLVELELEGMIQGQKKGNLGEPKMWRLSRKG